MLACGKSPITDRNGCRSTNLVFAISDHEHRARALDATAEVLEQVESRVVGPMHVLEYSQRPGALQLIERCGEDCIAATAGIDGSQQRTLRLPRDVVQGSEWARCKECVASAPQHPRGALLFREVLDQCGLADARFTVHERDTATTLGGAEPFGQISETLLALEQFHRMYVLREGQPGQL